jgi:hypothetical protein
MNKISSVRILQGDYMSLLDVIKNLFFGEKSENPEVEQTSVVKTEPEKPQAAPVVKEPLKTGLQIPEDSALKRHFISALKADIETNMPARPTDSTLKRHYDQTVEAELKSQLG